MTVSRRDQNIEPIKAREMVAEDGPINFTRDERGQH